MQIERSPIATKRYESTWLVSPVQWPMAYSTLRLQWLDLQRHHPGCLGMWPAFRSIQRCLSRWSQCSSLVQYLPTGAYTAAAEGRWDGYLDRKLETQLLLLFADHRRIWSQSEPSDRAEYAEGLDEFEPVRLWCEPDQKGDKHEPWSLSS
jgi:hypothetical protein